MRLLAVRLQNLNSLSGAHEVRFDEGALSAAGVFLITGPTGAGKSTLLSVVPGRKKSLARQLPAR